MCQRRMKEWQVFAHLESCPGPDAAAASPRKPNINTDTTQTQQAQPTGQMQRQQQKTLERLPSLSYSIFKEQALRKKLAELGISNQGPRPLLERRHKEWLTIWNANCDAAQPRRRAALLHDLDVWERTQGGRAPTATLGRAAQTAAAIRDKDFDGAAWASRHGDSFKDLIADARRSRLAAQKKSDDAAAEEEGADGENDRDDGGLNQELIRASPDLDTAVKTAYEEPAAPISSQANGFMQEQHS